MKLALSTLLASIALLSPQALALGGGLSLDLQYGVRDAEALYGVATANGDLRFINQGPSAAKVRWFDPLRGEEEVRVLGPGQVLVTQGHLGVPVSEGTMVLVEKVGPGPIATGLASIPSTPSMRDSAQSLHNNGAFAPTDAPQVLEFAESLLGTSSVAGGARCTIVNQEPSVDAFQSIDSNGDGAITFRLCEDGHTFAFYDEDALEFLAGVPSCPELSGIVVGSILAPHLQGRPAGTQLILSSTWMPHCTAGASLHDTLHCMLLEVVETP